MIIKSMSRKAPTFGQLIDYIGRKSDPQTGTVFARNLYHSGQDTIAVAGQLPLSAQARQKGVDTIRGVLSSDHVHMFVSVPPKLAVSDLVRLMKGRSSHKVQREFPHPCSVFRLAEETSLLFRNVGRSIPLASSLRAAFPVSFGPKNFRLPDFYTSISTATSPQLWEMPLESIVCAMLEKPWTQAICFNSHSSSVL